MSKELSKFNYSNVVKSIGHVCIWPGGVEYLVEDVYDEGKFDWRSKPTYNSYWDGCGYTKEEIKNMQVMYREANGNLGMFKKGLRVIIKAAKKGPGAMAMMAKAHTGYGPSNVWDYFMSLYRLFPTEVICEIGERKEMPMITSYINGSYDYTPFGY